MKKALKIISAILILAIFTSGGYCLGFKICEKRQIEQLRELPVSLPDAFTVTAHTGCEGTKMNSINAIQKGIAAGANTVEFDLNFKSDGTPVLTHGKVKNSKKYVTLDEAFEVISSYNDITVNVDLKSTDNLSAVQESAIKYNMLDRIFYTGVNNEDLPAVQNDSPLVKYFLNVNFDSDRKYDPEYISEFVDLIKDNGAIGINIAYNCLTDEMVSQFHNNNLLVSTYTVNDYADMFKVIQMAPDNITTRKPSKINEIIKEK